MSPFLAGFATELVKVSGLAGSVGRFVVKHPMISATAALTAGATAASAGSAYKEGLRGGEKPRYLGASAEGPSEAAYANYNQLFERPQTRRQVRELSKHYKESKFQR